MVPKLTAQQLLERIKQIKIDASAFKDYWQLSLPDLPLPPDYEINNAVRRLALDYLAEGIESYVAKLGQGNASTKAAMNYVCGAAWKMLERDNPSQEFHPTARRQRNAERDPDSPQWNGEAFGNATPQERQRILAETIAKQKAKGVQ
jgi:hypothetical protein